MTFVGGSRLLLLGGIVLTLTVCPCPAQLARNQKWIDTQRAILQREQILQQNRIDELHKAAADAYKESINRVVDWAKDQVNMVLFQIDPVLALQNLVNQNLQMYEEAIRGEPTAYVSKVAETLYTAIVSRLPEKLHPDLLDPTIIKQLLDLKTLRELKTKAETIDAIQERLTRIQTLIDNSQKLLHETNNEAATIPLDNPAVKELEDALATLPIRLTAIPEIQVDGGTGPPNAVAPATSTSDGSDLDKALNENMTSEMDRNNPFLPDLLIHTNSDRPPIEQLGFTLAEGTPAGAPDSPSLANIVETARQKRALLLAERDQLKATSAQYDQKI